MSKLVGNALVGQSGGPTCAINASLAGVIAECQKQEEIQTIYGMQNGIEGFLNEKLVPLTAFDDQKISVLKITPASYLGSCRKKLPDLDDTETYQKIFSLFEKYNIRYFFYIGGNDSMDTVAKLTAYQAICGYEMRVIGVPKTIDNDLLATDHTPGYGSAAKYIATVTQEIAYDCQVYTVKAVTIVEIMGRDTGWLTCSAGLSKMKGDLGADLIYCPEFAFSEERFIKDVQGVLAKKPNVVVAVSEGVTFENSDEYQSGAVDVFGHKYLAGIGKSLERLVKREIGCKVRCVELNLPQRCASHIGSKTDIDESFRIGARAVFVAVKGKSGKMMIFRRKTGDQYRSEISFIDVSEIANKTKYIPENFMNEEHNFITEECYRYIAPLTEGETKVKYQNGLPVFLKLGD